MADPKMNNVPVLLLNSGVAMLDYRVPPGVSAPPGTIVRAPIGPRQVMGVVWDHHLDDGHQDFDEKKLRPVQPIADAPMIPQGLRRLIDWTADYYVSNPAMVLKMAMPVLDALSPDMQVPEYQLAGDATGDDSKGRITEGRLQAITAIGDHQGTVRELTIRANVSEAVIRGMIKTGLLIPADPMPDHALPTPDPDFDAPTLSAEQQAVANELVAAVESQAFAPLVLHGVTGSGKTETYFEAVAAALRAGRQVMILLPEIALTEPFVDRFVTRFGVEPMVWHSDMRHAERRRGWRAIASGEARVVMGARSALYLPFPQLGLIVVDEAHEMSFKQQDGVTYHARDVAVMRARMEGCTVILASATPALETRVQVAKGHYRQLDLPSRFGGATMPEIAAIDLLADPPMRGTWLAPALVNAMTETLARGEQVLLFLNRRGYAPLTLCRHCGHRCQCPNCSAWMVEHRRTHRLLCHHCGHVEPVPTHCPECNEADSLVACGPGVERIAEEAGRLFPDATIVQATSDTLSSPAKAQAFVHRMESGEINVVVGTQLITKGYHFPELTLVGVVDADLGLQGRGFAGGRAQFPAVSHRLRGRAGRGEKPGKVFIQTHDPKVPVIRALVSGDEARFYREETEMRRLAMAPPFGRFVAIVISSEDADEATALAKTIGRAAPHVKGMQVFGPAPAPLAKLRTRYRHRLLVHAERQVPVQRVVRDWLGGVFVPKGCRVGVDVDPYSFM